MVVQMQFGNEETVEKRYTYRNIIKNVNLSQLCEAFFMYRDSYRWGKLIQLKGKEKITLRVFGNTVG